MSLSAHRIKDVTDSIDKQHELLKLIVQKMESLAVVDSITAVDTAALASLITVSEKQAKDMAKIYDKRKAQEAAVIIDGLDLPIAISVMSKMKKRQAAKVMAALHPSKAITLSREMALND